MTAPSEVMLAAVNGLIGVDELQAHVVPEGVPAVVWMAESIILANFMMYTFKQQMSNRPLDTWDYSIDEYGTPEEQARLRHVLLDAAYVVQFYQEIIGGETHTTTFKLIEDSFIHASNATLDQWPLLPVYRDNYLRFCLTNYLEVVQTVNPAPNKEFLTSFYLPTPEPNPPLEPTQPLEPITPDDKDSFAPTLLDGQPDLSYQASVL